MMGYMYSTCTHQYSCCTRGAVEESPIIRTYPVYSTSIRIGPAVHHTGTGKTANVIIEMRITVDKSFG